MLPFARYFAFLIPILALIVTLACSEDAAPGDCIDAARDAGVPDRVIEWMKDPVEEWGTIERIAIREALEKFGIGDFCADVEQKLTFAESSPMNNALEMAKDAAKAALTPSPEPPTPAPNPTRRPPSTPLPAPTPPSPLVTPLPAHAAAHHDRWPEIPEVVEVTFSGTAGEQDSKFIVRFDEPVIVTNNERYRAVEVRKEVVKEVEVPGETVVVEKEVVKTVEVPGETIVVEKEVVKEIQVPIETVVVEKEVIKEVEVEKVIEIVPDAYDSDSSVTLEVGYSGYGSDRRIPLQTKTSPDQPSDELSFGPIDREFAVAYGILLAGEANITDIDGNPAVIDFSNVVFVNPGYKDDITDSKLVNCVASMEILGYSPIILDNVKNLRSDKMTDSERIEWRLLLDEEFRYGIDGVMRLPCRQLWSEAINSNNESKRNRDFHCIYYLSRGTEVHSDAMELVNRPYASLDASDRMQLRLVLNSDPDLSSECAMYYPQLFYGRWIPMTPNQ